MLVLITRRRLRLLAVDLALLLMLMMAVAALLLMLVNLERSDLALLRAHRIGLPRSCRRWFTELLSPSKLEEARFAIADRQRPSKAGV